MLLLGFLILVFWSWFLILIFLSYCRFFIFFWSCIFILYFIFFYLGFWSWFLILVFLIGYSELISGLLSRRLIELILNIIGWCAIYLFISHPNWQEWFFQVISGLGLLSTSSYAQLRSISSPIQTMSFEVVTTVPSGVIAYFQLPQNFVVVRNTNYKISE